MSNVLLATVYPGTGRPSGFTIEKSENAERIDRLKESHGYSVCLASVPDDFTVQDAWRTQTIVDSDGVTQWGCGS